MTVRNVINLAAAVFLMALASVKAAEVDHSLRAVQDSDKEHEWFSFYDMVNEWTNRYELLDYDYDTSFDFMEESDLMLRDKLFYAYKHLREGDYDASLDAFTEAFKMNPKSLRVRFGLGVLYVNTGKIEKALEMYHWLLEQKPKDHRVHNNLSWIYSSSIIEELRDPEKAVYHAQMAMLDAYDNYSVWSTLAEAYFSAKKYDRAERAARMAVSLSREQHVNDLTGYLYEEQLERCMKAAEAFSVLH